MIEGTLSCRPCGASFPVRAGVPRFVSGHGNNDASSRTARAFGWEWLKFSSLEPYYERQFLDWVAPMSPADFQGKVVVEGGCGKGRHTRLAAGYGSRAVIAVDLSNAVDVAYSNTRDLPNAHVIQADLLDLPVQPGCCDLAFSIGVLHHLPDPGLGFQALVTAVRPLGEVSVWVYGAENNGWIVRIVSPIRDAITSRLPPQVLYVVSWAGASLLWLALVCLYRPAQRKEFGWLRRALFYYPYLSYICRYPFKEIHAIVHDHLAAPVAHYLRREQVEAWYERAGATNVVIDSHNGNSWRGHGIMPAAWHERTTMGAAQ